LAKQETGFKQYIVNLKGYEVPTVTYAGSYADLDSFLQVNTINKG
jgi:adenylate cyclase